MNITYKFKVKNDMGHIKTVYVNGDTFNYAVEKMKHQHGSEWIVFDSEIISAK